MKPNGLIFAAILLNPLQALADEQFEVNYGVVEDAEELSSGLLGKRFGYTVKYIDGGKRVRLESKTKDILVGDCVAVDSNEDETRIRRVANANCPTPSPAVAPQQESTTDGGIIEEAVPPGIPAGKAVEPPSVSPSCERALERVREAKTMRGRADARREASRLCN